MTSLPAVSGHRMVSTSGDGAVDSYASRRDPRRFVRPTASIVAVLLIWELVSLLAGNNRARVALVPGPVDVIAAAKDLANYWKGGLGVRRTDRGGPVTWAGAGLSLGYNGGLTALRVLIGFTLGTSVGVGLAALTSWSEWLRRLIALPAHFARMLPLLALLPLFGIWFGSSEQGDVLFIAFTVFVLMFVVAFNAIGNVPPSYEQYARALGAGPLRVYVRVVLPAALPQLRTGLTLGLGFAWSAAISGEFNGLQYGLGHIAGLAQYFSQTNMLALIALITVALAGISYLAAHRVLHWMTRWAD